MDHLSLRKVQHPQAPNNYRVILKTEHDGEFEMGSIGLQTFTSTPALTPHEPGTPTWRCLYRLSLSSAWLAPLNRGSLKSAHIHGTDVEEPYTASNPDMADASHIQKESRPQAVPG
jgi:hypothetical protein